MANKLKPLILRSGWPVLADTDKLRHEVRIHMPTRFASTSVLTHIHSVSFNVAQTIRIRTTVSTKKNRIILSATTHVRLTRSPMQIEPELVTLIVRELRPRPGSLPHPAGL